MFSKFTKTFFILMVVAVIATMLHLTFITQEKSHDHLFETTGTNMKCTTKEFLLCNPNICSGLKETGMIMYIYNTMDKENAKEVVRSTYGNKAILKTLNIRIMFVMGCKQNGKLSSKILEEFNQHQDILVGNFVDSYKILTLKGTNTLKFLSEHCKNVTWIMKADDDTFVDLQKVRQKLSQWKSSKPEPPMFGFTIVNGRPFICPHIPKWCIPKSFNITRYPPYLSGIAYVFSSKLLSPMMAQVNKTKKYMSLVDDVYMTGYLTKNISKQFVNWKRDIIPNPTDMVGYRKRKAVIAHLKNSNLIKQIWSKYN